MALAGTSIEYLVKYPRCPYAACSQTTQLAPTGNHQHRQWRPPRITRKNGPPTDSARHSPQVQPAELSAGFSFLIGPNGKCAPRLISAPMPPQPGPQRIASRSTSLAEHGVHCLPAS